MFTEIQAPNQHFNAYYQDNTLLIQFILTEFIHTHQLYRHFKLSIDANLGSTQPMKESLNPLFHFLTQLLGHFSHCDPLYSSRWTKGPLSKMKDYCELLSKNGNSSEKILINMQTTIYQTWTASIHCLELVSTFHLFHTQSKNSSFTPSFLRSLAGLKGRLNMLTKQIPRLANLYWNNENVAYFLIRNKEELNTIYGIEWAEKFFKSYAKQTALTPLLVRRYKERGFDHLPLPTKEEVYC